MMGAPPIHPIVSHGMAAFSMAVFIVVGYVGALFLTQEPVRMDHAPEEVVEEAPVKEKDAKAKRPPRKKGR